MYVEYVLYTTFVSKFRIKQIGVVKISENIVMTWGSVRFIMGVWYYSVTRLLKILAYINIMYGLVDANAYGFYNSI